MDRLKGTKKRIALLGSTGSIGTQALEVVRSFPGMFEVEVLTAGNNHSLLIRQAREFLPNAVVIGNPLFRHEVVSALQDLPVKVFSGEDSIVQVMEMESIDIVLSAMVGYSGLKPTLEAVKQGKTVALANKETLVIAGDLVMELARKTNAFILPVDSEHSAIFQCLTGEEPCAVEKIYLTASGGPFRGKTMEFLGTVTKEEALKHPNWKMGKKITIDSASMMNKGLEVIEASWLFDLRPDQIEVIIHPQSVIHSIVQFSDGSMKAQLGVPDMRGPILYALSFPGRLPSVYPRLNFSDYPVLSFEKPDRGIFRNLGLAYEALSAGGNMPCILNAANEVAVQSFLDHRISFPAMPDLIESCMKKVTYIRKPSYDDYVDTHKETVRKAREFVDHKLS